MPIYMQLPLDAFVVTNPMLPLISPGALGGLAAPMVKLGK